MKLIFGTGGRFARFNYKKLIKLTNYALEQGITKFDTGYTYGNHKCQPLLAKCLKPYLQKDRDKYSISTKCPPLSGEYIENCVNHSLSSFNCSYLDYLHLWGASPIDFERRDIVEVLKSLIKKGKIKNASVCTQDIRTIKKVSTGFINEISALMIDFNLLQQNRLPYIKVSKKNNIAIFGGTALCQGFLLSSPLEMFCRSKSLFYLARAIVKKETKNYLANSKKLRNYLRSNYKKQADLIPLSYVINEKNVDFISIGMLSRNSIKKNISILKQPIDIKITKSIGKWALKNCQVKDLYED